MRIASAFLGLVMVVGGLACGGSERLANAPADGGAPTDGGSSEDAGDPGLTLTMGPFNVPANSEVFKCQTFANPFAGVDTDIKTYEEHMTHGSHHMFVFFMPGAADGPLEDCPNGGLEFHPYPFTSQVPDATETFPDTVGSRIPGSTGLMLNAHFLNVGATDFQATLTVTLHVAAPGTVTQHAGVIFMNNIGITIPPGASPTTVSATCTLPQDMNVMSSASHMHTRATEFTATAGTQTLYTTNTWSSPVPAVYSPPAHLTSGTNVTFSCTYLNDTGQTLTFGESALTNVMCIYEMQFYPVADPTNPTITCMTL